jgi:hypothetical protein
MSLTKSSLGRDPWLVQASKYLVYPVCRLTRKPINSISSRESLTFVLTKKGSIDGSCRRGPCDYLAACSIIRIDQLATNCVEFDSSVRWLVAIYAIGF